MTMTFRAVKDAVEAILVAKILSGGYRVTGYRDDAIDSNNLNGRFRQIQVYSQSGDFRGASSGYVGSVTHDPVINIDLTTMMPARIDLAVFDNPESTQGERAAALAASGNASHLADVDMDQFCDFVYQELMSPVNILMGLPVGTVSNRWIPRWEKSKPMNDGGSVIITAQMDLHYRCNEDLVGETPTAATEGVNGQIKIGDDIPRAAVKIETEE